MGGGRYGVRGGGGWRVGLGLWIGEAGSVR